MDRAAGGRAENAARGALLGSVPRPGAGAGETLAGETEAVAAPTQAVVHPVAVPDPGPAPEPPPGLADAVAGVVAAALPAVAARIPAAPAAALGRLAVPAPPVDVLRHSPPRGSGIDQLLAERLLGALELTVEELELDTPAELAPHVRVPTTGALWAVASSSAESATRSAVGTLDQLAPHVRGLVGGLVSALARHPLVRPLLDVRPGTEAEVAAAHGRAHLALAVATSSLVLRAARTPIVGAGPPVVVGVALDAAARVLTQRPMPAVYAAALRERRRAEYLLPRYSSGSVEVGEHRFGLVEGAFPTGLGEPANGLVQVVAGGLVVRTAAESGPVPVSLRVGEGEPDEVERLGWDEVVEVSYEAVEGSASVTGPALPAGEQLLGQPPPWAGPVRARVHASGRDDLDERYQIVVWSAPLAPEVVHKATDRLGHRLRGEPEPPVVARPEVAYRWLDGTHPLGMAATITVVTASSPAEVIAAFGGDPAVPEPIEDLIEAWGVDPWVAVLPIEGAVLAVEDNGWQGAQRPVLRAVSAGGRAASAFWNVNGMRQVAFARGGDVLAALEWLPSEPLSDPDVRAAFDGLRYDDPRDLRAKGLLAVERFTGHPVRAEDVDRLLAAGVGYRILPHLPELYPEELLPDGSRRWPSRAPLGPDTELLTAMSGEALRDLAWWTAAEAAGHAGLSADPAVAASLDARALTPVAERLARESGLEGGSTHRQMWLTLHAATNPDALAAAVQALDTARWVFGPAAADFFDRARARLG